MITYEIGKKGPGDLKILVNGKAIKYSELAEMAVQVIKNEDRIYPKEGGYMAGDYFIEFILKAMVRREVTPELLREYKL